MMLEASEPLAGGGATDPASLNPGYKLSSHRDKIIPLGPSLRPQSGAKSQSKNDLREAAKRKVLTIKKSNAFSAKPAQSRRRCAA